MASYKPTMLHPIVAILKRELKFKRCKYAQLSEITSIPEQRIKNLMTGRVDMTLNECDIFCDYLNISPVNLMSMRKDLNNSMDYLDITKFNIKLRTAIFSLYSEVLRNNTP